MKEEASPSTMSLDQIRSAAAALAAEMKTQPAAHVAPELRARFIRLRTALFTRGIYDPVLVRFDSATAPVAPPAEIGAHLEKLTTLA